MKKILKISGIILGVILLIIITLPIVFKDKISEKVQAALNENLDAQLILNPDKISLSLIRHFPHFSLAIDEFGIINKAPFEGDTLLYASRLDVSVNFLSVLGGGPIHIRNIELDKPRINVLILPDGRANYNIAKPSTDTTASAEEKKESAFALKIQGWAVNDLNLRYVDGTSGTAASLVGMTHEGSGDFTQELVNVKTKTTIADLSVTFDSVNYLNHKKFASELAIDWNMKDSKGHFGDNFVQLNDFKFSFSGDVNVGGAKPEFDVKFGTNETEIKSLLSLVPALYSKEFDNLKAEGKMEFNGLVKGFYDSTSLPGFETRLQVQNGKIQYPNLPKSIENLNIDLGLAHSQGSLELLKSNLQNFSLKLGENPFSAKGRVEGLSKPVVDITANGNLNLADLLSAFPMEGLELKGLARLNVVAKGQYNPENKQFPVVSAAVDFSNGFVKSKEFPQPLEAINFSLKAANPDGKMASTAVDLEKMSFQLDNEPFDITARIRDLDDVQYYVAAKGSVDLAKITKIFPVEGMTLSGKIRADLKTAGRMSDVTAKKYDKLPTSGTMDVSDFQYVSKDLTKPVQIRKATAVFNSKEAKLESMQMVIGQSDFAMAGSIRNYLGYFLREETLQGNLSLQSNLLNTNELMTLTGEPKAVDPKAAEQPLEPVALPKNIDFTFMSDVAKVLYDNMTLEKLKGAVMLRNGILNLNKLEFLTLDGSVLTTGKYDPTSISAPRFDFDLDMKNISISKAYSTFTSLQTMAPAAKNMNGKVTTRFKFAGEMDKTMKPSLPTTNGGGVLKVNDGQIKDLKIASGINSIAKTKFPTEANLKDVSIAFEIRNGRVHFEPFNLGLAGQMVNISGSNGLDGTVDYLMKTSVPAGAAGSAVAGALSQITGKSITSPKDIKFEIGATGPGSNPKYRIVKVDAGSVKDEAKTAVKEKLDQAKAEAEAKAKAEAERLRQEAEAKAQAEKERLKKEAENKAKEELDKLKKKFRF